jgi:arylformamidase
MTTDGWIDVSVPVYSGMAHWPDNPPVVVERLLDMDRGDAANVSKLSLGAHTGTHMDAPRHFLRDGAGIDALPFAATLGPARVIGIRDTHSIKAAELAGYDLRQGERVLFKTTNSARCWGTDEFVEDFVSIARGAAAYLAERGVQTIGVDYLSVGGFREDGVETHAALLGGGVWIIEGLNLAAVAPGSYELICLPLRLLGADGAPARAILRPLPTDTSPQDTGA